MGAAEPGAVDPLALSQAAGLDTIKRAQGGLLADMDDAALAVYRVCPAES